MNNTETLISLSKTELQNINGGEVPRAYYMDQDVINQNWDNLCTFGGVTCIFQRIDSYCIEKM
jgi:bacteriocin-like protein